MKSFAQWWVWGLEQADAARRDEPYQLTQEFFPPDRHPGKSRDGGRHNILGGRPFTIPFEDYLEDEIPPRSPLRDSLSRLYNPRKVQTHEYRILFAMLEGHKEPETIRVLIGGCRVDFFEAAAIRALAYLDGRINAELPNLEPLTRREQSVRSSQQKTRRGPRTSPATGIGSAHVRTPETAARK